MPDLIADTRVAPAGAAGCYAASLSPDWAVWGPSGGYLAALALRAAMSESRFRRPASFYCHFLAVGEFAPVNLAVIRLGGGKRAESLRVDLRQGDRLLLAATVWMVDEGLRGYEHEALQPPEVDGPTALPDYAALAGDEYAEWYPIWRSIEGRPLRWREPPGWNATIAAHAWPFPFLTPNLDLMVQVHRFAPDETWLLAHGVVPQAADGLVGCVSRLWTTDGRLLATGASKHSCRPNPQYAEELARARAEGLLPSPPDSAAKPARPRS